MQWQNYHGNHMTGHEWGNISWTNQDRVERKCRELQEKEQQRKTEGPTRQKVSRAPNRPQDPQKHKQGPDMSSEASFASLSVPTTIALHRLTQGRHNSDISKEMVDNILVSNGKAGELNQFLCTIESFSKLYRAHKVENVILQTRGKPQEIISHALEDDPDIEWSTIKRKLTSNYGSTKGRIDASLQLRGITMKEDETVGEYLVPARTLIKTKLRVPTQWNTEYDKSNTYYVCNGVRPQNLKKKALNKLLFHK